MLCLLFSFVSVFTVTLIDQVYELVAVVRDAHQPTMSSSTRVTIYITDANDHAPVWIVPSQLNATVIAVSSYTAAGTAVARVRAADDDDDDNGRVTYSVSAERHLSELPPFDVDPDTGVIRLRTDLSAEVRRRFRADRVVIIVGYGALGHVPPPSTSNHLIFTARSELRKVLFLALSVTFLFVHEISRKLLNGFAPNSHGKRG